MYFSWYVLASSISINPFSAISLSGIFPAIFLSIVPFNNASLNTLLLIHASSVSVTMPSLAGILLPSVMPAFAVMPVVPAWHGMYFCQFLLLNISPVKLSNGSSHISNGGDIFW